MEHLHHFGLSDDPFRNELRSRDYFETPASRDALLRLERGVRQQRGLLLLTGETGTGKSLVVRQLLEALEDEVFEASMIVLLSAETDAAWLLARFARLLGVEEPAEERDAVLAQLYEQLAIVREEGRHAVLIVDDAEALAAGDALADACGLLKLEYEERRLFSLLLVGGPQLARAIAAEPGLRERVEVHVPMRALDPQAAGEYLNQRLAQAGGDATLFEPAAAQAVCTGAGGRPGRINALADNALYEAFLAGRACVSPADVARAQADLGGACPAAAPGVAARKPGPAPRRDPLDAPAPAALYDRMGSPAGDLDADLDAVFANSGPLTGARRLPSEGPPKDEAEEDLVVALVEE